MLLGRNVPWKSYARLCTSNARSFMVSCSLKPAHAPTSSPTSSGCIAIRGVDGIQMMWRKQGSFNSLRFLATTTSQGSGKKKGKGVLYQDPYYDHKINLEKAQSALDKVIKPGMTDEEIFAQVDKAFEEHIPPVPHWTEIENNFDDAEAQAKAEQMEVKRQARKPIPKVLPSVDALGRAYSTGKRKTAVARVWVTAGDGTVIVNKMHMVDYFARMALREEIYQPLQVIGRPMTFNVWCTVRGGGLSGQAGAIKLGIARALQAFDPTFRKELKKYKLLTQDDRKVERKKPGLAKARKAFQWVKR